MRLIDADALFEVIKKSMDENPHIEETQRAMHIHEHKYFLTLLAGIPTIQPEPAIPLSWIDKYIEWLKSFDNEFAKLAAAHISVMVKKWRDEQNERPN